MNYKNLKIKNQNKNKKKDNLSISSSQYIKGERVLVYVHIPPFKN